MEKTIPLFPIKSLAVTLDFYQALGFTVTYQQSEPYLYAAVRRDEVELHLARLSVWGSKHTACLVFVPDVAAYHRAFADCLRAKYGSIPLAGYPRLTRLRSGHTRFHLFDPAGNALLYIDQHESDADYATHDVNASALAQALDNANFLRDTYTNDKGAARALDLALARYTDALPLDIARAVAARAELAVALGDPDLAQSLRAELARLPLSDEDRARYHAELNAADDLVRWRG